MQQITPEYQQSPLLEQDEEPPSRPRRQILRPAPGFLIPNRQLTFPFFPRQIEKEALSRKRAFRKRFFPAITDKQWNNWQWQIQNRISTPGQLGRFLQLSNEEQAAFHNLNVKVPLGITPYYMSLLSTNEPESPLRRTVVPTVHELFKVPGETNDPLNEEGQSLVPGLVHRYPDRVLLLLIDFCSVYCRYCTRSRMIGRGDIHAGGSRLEKAIQYIRDTPAIRDVLLSGGDPLTLSDKKLDWVISQIRAIPHVEIIRIGTKVPAVLPQRITPQLVKMLKKYHPLWMSLHFTHPDECTPEAYRATRLLADAGIPLGSQTVLLKGVNDTVDTMKDLMHHLMKMRVRPYYIYQCDPVPGTSHFRTTVEKGMDIIRGLRGHTSGYAVPNYVIDAPGGGGKIPVMPNYVMGRQDNDLVLNNYEDKLFRYPDPADAFGHYPLKESACGC